MAEMPRQRVSQTRRLPLARKEQLIVKELKDELLVYDLEREKAHCLNSSAALVWQLCDGQTAPAEIAKTLSRQSNQPIDTEFVWLALDQLGQDHLLVETMERPTSIPRMSRREAVKRIGIGVALTVPVIYSIAVPTVAQVGSCRRRNQACSSNAECCSGICRRSGKCR